MIAKFRGRSLKISPTTSKGPTENLKKMSWDNPIFPMDAKNSIGFFVPFFLGWPGLVGDSVEKEFRDTSQNLNSFSAFRQLLNINIFPSN